MVPAVHDLSRYGHLRNAVDMQQHDFLLRKAPSRCAAVVMHQGM